ncbi:nuclease-related domain-containing protein [Gracilibacillus sp. S3-1-1]|uniref:Nuclease-related domain-containing protein n=1 Tax=Gracilibacillus pellucidus TaxID=3095368 RepID=A0ACC6M5Z4_9BACI|nr:nuclease-related domain-containing protein [Gracilibacillus sp. S3-1-1]MDX8046340.1 nuclease-related domain-containing protein [Gracilibacillus sp. S3-1-1]
MIKKIGQKPYGLSIFEALQARVNFTQQETNYFHQLQVGYDGEKRWEQLLEKELPDHFIILSDIRLELGTTTFQIDSILLTGDTLYLFDVKN